MSDIRTIGSAQGQVVVVEDDAGMRGAIVRVLKATGLAVASFVTGEAALRDPTALQARCLVLDIHLPDISGFELFERLGALGNKSPVIFITARDDLRNRERALELGALDYLVKPFSGRKLAAIITRTSPA